MIPKSKGCSWLIQLAGRNTYFDVAEIICSSGEQYADRRKAIFCDF
jgi:hypothetical protein